ncbi:efflux RND transporter periplasmic adaptor subunit [Microbacter margulisiae]|uniref:HlyD family secretion protein n=1 Tax=Microbacter margulisiae TaxID=1350067 RepID=A0A7W5DS26_9PORP|nr:efflux RND transporter periplasmic adaptor subunit [Microbacter margulisiae]MBB3187876.1 HlyD family secretion protein [Microbacter margulisiae]
MKTKTIVWAVIALLLIIAGFTLLRKSDDIKQMPVTAKVTVGDISTTVTATGTVEPIKTITVGTQVSGIISKVYVDYNSVVKKGQVLAELDKTVLNSQLASATTDLNNAKTQMDYQKSTYNRDKVLYAKKAISATDMETATYNYETAKLNYQKASYAKKVAETNLGYATIYSPIDGVILSKDVDAGQTVAASFSTPTLFSITNNLHQMQVLANVDEADIGQVKDGQTVTFTVDAYPNDTFQGVVTQVRLEPTTTSNVVTYTVVINAPNPQLKLLPGLTANVTIYIIQKNHILLIPNKALNFHPTGKPAGISNDSMKTIWVMNGQAMKPVQIKVGVTDDIHTEVLQGLHAGDEVVTDIKTLSSKKTVSSDDAGASPFMPKRPNDKRKPN